MEYKFILEPYKSKSNRYICPKCGRKHQFTRYINTIDNTYLSDEVGRCNREINCGYHYTPQQYFQNNNQPIINTKIAVKRHSKSEKKEADYIELEILSKTLAKIGEDNLSRYLFSKFSNKDLVLKTLKKYKVGYYRHFAANSTVFWQIDTEGRVRSGKIMKYDLTTGRRIKKPFLYLTWIHSVLEIHDFNLKQCFFGLHLINDNKSKTIGIVESEKTALVMTILMPELIWLASGNLFGINDQKAKELLGRKVVLYPDLSNGGLAFEKWSKLAKKYGFQISSYLELNANKEHKIKGYDLADFIDEFNANSNKNPSKSNKQNEDNLNLDNKLKSKLNFIPYFSPSPAYLIDKTIIKQPEKLMLSNHIFWDTDNIKIKIIGTINFGSCYCSGHNYKTCEICAYNCIHICKINNDERIIISHKQALLLEQNQLKLSDIDVANNILLTIKYTNYELF